MKKIIVVMLIVLVALTSAFAADLSYLEDFQVKEGDMVCVIMDIDDMNEEISFRIYLNEDKTSVDDYCNRVYRITEGGKFKNSTFEIVSVTFGGMDYTPIMEGYEFTGEELIEAIELDLAIFSDIIPGVEIDSEGSYYYGYDINLNELYDFAGEVVDYIYDN